MECIAPEEIADGDLIAYIDGVAGDEVAAHILICAHCQAEVVALRRTDAYVSVVAPRASCPPAESLLHYEMGWLDARQHQAIADHLSTCAFCPGELAQLAAVAPVEMPDVPWWDKVAFEGRRLLEAVIQVGGAPLAPALRGDAVAPSVYEVGPYKVVVISEPAGVLSGYLGDRADRPLTGASVRVYAGQDEVARSTVDKFGHFAFTGLAPGEYGLAVFVADAVVVTTVNIY